MLPVGYACFRLAGGAPARQLPNAAALCFQPTPPSGISAARTAGTLAPYRRHTHAIHTLETTEAPESLGALHQGRFRSGGQLQESPEYELCQISERKPGVLEELAAERARLLDKETAELERQAQRLAQEIEELAGVAPGRIA